MPVDTKFARHDIRMSKAKFLQTSEKTQIFGKARQESDTPAMVDGAMILNESDFITFAAHLCACSGSEVKAALNLLKIAVKHALAEGYVFRWQGFAQFEIRSVPTRKRYDVKNRKMMVSPASERIHIKASKRLLRDTRDLAEEKLKDLEQDHLLESDKKVNRVRS